MSIYTISDLHLWHPSFLEFEGLIEKGYNIDSYLSMVKERWNSVVSPSDIVVVVGDFIWKTAPLGDAIKFVKSLNGHKVLVLGNHDQIITKQENSSLRACFKEIHSGYYELKYNKTLYVFSHYPINFSNRHWNDNTIMVYGHVHNTMEEGLVRKFNAISYSAWVSNSSRPNSNYGHLMVNVGGMMNYMNYTPMPLENLKGIALTRLEGDLENL